MATYREDLRESVSKLDPASLQALTRDILAGLPEESRNTALKSAIADATNRLDERGRHRLAENVLEGLPTEEIKGAIVDEKSKLDESDRQKIAGDILHRLPERNLETTLNDAIVEGARRLPQTSLQAATQTMLANLPDEERKKTIVSVAAKLSESDKRALAREFMPEQGTVNVLYLITVCAFGLVLVGAFVAIAAGMFRSPAQGALVRPELVLTLFTGAAGFLAGLFAPSPTAKPKE